MKRLNNVITLIFGMMLILPLVSKSQTRDPLLRPFSSESIWNMPIHNNAVLVDAQLPAPTGWGVGRDDIHIIATPSAPSKNVYELGSDYWTNRCPGSAPSVLFSAPIPNSYTYYHQSHNNVFSIFLNNTTVRETQAMQYCTNTGKWTSKWVTGNINITGNGTDWGMHGGTHMIGLGGSIRVHEMVPGGEIKHALSMPIHLGKHGYYNTNESDGKPGYRWPAHTADSYAGQSNQYTGSVPALQSGSLLTLPSTFNVNALRTEPGRMIARAIKNYGAYVTDDTAWGDVVFFDTESGPAGSVVGNAYSHWGISWDTPATKFNQKGVNNVTWNWSKDIADIVEALHVVNNNTSSTIGGGPTSDHANRRAPLLCPLGTAGSGQVCNGSSGSSGSGSNLLNNGSFEQPGSWSQSIPSWETWSGTGSQAADFTESSSSQTQGSWHLTHYNGQSGTWNCYTSQLVTGLSNGTYTVRAKARKSGNGFSSAQIQAKDFGGGTTASATIPTSGSMQVVQITGINVTNGQCRVGLWTNVQNGSNWPYIHLDEFEFFKTSGAREVVEGKPSVQATSLYVYPNPVEDILNFSETVSGVIYSMDGSQVAVLKNVTEYMTDRLKTGVYLFHSNTGQSIRIQVK